MRLFVPAAAKSSVDPARIARTRPTNECAQCGESIFMPEWSEWLNPACARHLWQCEACGYSFETTVRFAAA
ncbi:MAG: hypothetical protein NTU64_16825 [Hyphomicrobiales bacterium]|nr:hypothetical protein [Hyphomicrobiales bacterium]